MVKKSFVHYLTKYLVDFLFYSGIICTLTVPFLIKPAVEYYGYNSNLSVFFGVILFLSGLSAVYILWQLKVIFKTLLSGSPFIQRNVNALRKMAVASSIIAVIFIVKCITFFTIASGLIVIVFSLASLFCLTLKDVFKEAVYYKEETDLTI